jgi:low affinity Fe/Cu permease
MIECHGPHRPAAEGVVMNKKSIPVLMPSEVSSRVGFFDRFAGLAARLASRAPFFAFCLLLVILWLVQGVFLIVSKGNLHAFLDARYQLEINTTTTIITFLMVALLQNSQTRTDQATQHKLNAIADGLADLMEHVAAQSPDSSLEKDMTELRAAIGLETREGTSRNTN